MGRLVDRFFKRKSEEIIRCASCGEEISKEDAKNSRDIRRYMDYNTRYYYHVKCQRKARREARKNRWM